jgi:hypothetical protein
MSPKPSVAESYSGKGIQYRCIVSTKVKTIFKHVQTGWSESQKDPNCMSERTNCSQSWVLPDMIMPIFDMAMKPIDNDDDDDNDDNDA